MTKELLAEKGLTVDEERFKELVQEQKVRARAAHKGAGAEAWEGTGNVTKDMPATEFTGYTSLCEKTKIAAVIADGESRQFADSESNITLVLKKTPFYAESGGQVGDIGTICGEGFTFTVENTTKTHEGVILHHGKITDGESLAVGEAVTAQVDEAVRRSAMRNHTAAHLLQAALRDTLGTHVEQAGQLVNASHVRFDFTHFSALTADELKTVERKVNDAVLAAVPVETKEMPIDEAKKLGAMALFGEKYGDIVRVVRAGDFSTELCGGTHVQNTGNIGLFKIVSESSVASGVRRIEAVTGLNVLQFIDDNLNTIHEAAAALKVNNPAELVSKAAAATAEVKALTRELETLHAQIAAEKAKSMLSDAKDIGGVRLIVQNFGSEAPDALRSMCDKARESGDDIVALFAGVNPEKGTVTFSCAAGKAAIAKAPTPAISFVKWQNSPAVPAAANPTAPWPVQKMLLKWTKRSPVLRILSNLCSSEGNKMEDCLFCKIIAGEIPSKKLYEDEQCYAFYDINPQSDTHFWLSPKPISAARRKSLRKIPLSWRTFLK